MINELERINQVQMACLRCMLAFYGGSEKKEAMKPLN